MFESAISPRYTDSTHYTGRSFWIYFTVIQI